MDPGFFYETVAPLLIVGNTSLLCISTLTSEINFYTRLIRMRDKATNKPIFTVLSIQLACEACREQGRAADCVHMLHLVPRWQSSERHLRLKTIMQDRPDLIESELSGMAFESIQQVFRPADVDAMLYNIVPDMDETNERIFIVIDPAAGGPRSDYAIFSFVRKRGRVTVRTRFATPMLAVYVFVFDIVYKRVRALALVLNPPMDHRFEVGEESRCLVRVHCTHLPRTAAAGDRLAAVLVHVE